MDMDKFVANASIMIPLLVIATFLCIRTVERKHEGSMFTAKEWRGAHVLNAVAVAVVIAGTSAFVSGALIFLLSRWPINITVWSWMVAWAVCGFAFACISLPFGNMSFESRQN